MPLEDERMNFEEWWEKESGWGGEKLAEYELAREAWNKALEQAERVVDEINPELVMYFIGQLEA